MNNPIGSCLIEEFTLCSIFDRVLSQSRQIQSKSMRTVGGIGREHEINTAYHLRNWSGQLYWRVKWIGNRGWMGRVLDVWDGKSKGKGKVKRMVWLREMRETQWRRNTLGYCAVFIPTEEKTRERERTTVGERPSRFWFLLWTKY